MNSITVDGRLTRDPEERRLPNGNAVAQFSIANDRRWKRDSTNEWEVETSFFNVQCYGTLAENVIDSCSKGSHVMVAGRLKQRSYEVEGGAKRQVIEIIADDVAVHLRWVTADIHRRDRDAPRQQAPAPRGSSRQPSGMAYEQDPDEEPF